MQLIAFPLRQLLAAMHYNENASREHAQTAQGTLRYRVTYPKYKKGDYVVRKILTKSTYGTI